MIHSPSVTNHANVPHPALYASEHKYKRGNYFSWPAARRAVQTVQTTPRSLH
jgi:hypothetical protein